MSDTAARLSGSALILPRGGSVGGINAGESALRFLADGTIVQQAPDGTQAPLDLTGFKRGANLGDADVTIQPFTDNCSLYVIPPNTLTANRTYTLGNTSAPGAGIIWVCTIVRYDRTAFTVTIKKADTTTIYTDPISPTRNAQFQFGCSAGVWAVSQASIIP